MQEIVKKPWGEAKSRGFMRGFPGLSQGRTAELGAAQGHPVGLFWEMSCCPIKRCAACLMVVASRAGQVWRVVS